MKPSRLFALSLLAFVQSAVAADWQPLPGKAPAPKDNPTTAAKVALGQKLFLDPRLSATGTVSCNSCHNVMAGGDDNRPVAMGIHGKTGGRSAPTVWNSAFNATQFWDGRAATLEDQAKGPVVADVEMGMGSLDDVVARLRQIPGYEAEFKKVFGGSQPITADNMAKAIAAYERTLITPDSPYDRYVKGDKKALSTQQQRGMQKFADAGCVACHSGPTFNGQSGASAGAFMKFPAVPGSDYEAKYGFSSDLGHYNVTKRDEDKNTWKVPTLRNVALTAPYFHNGAVVNLDEAVKVMAKTQLGMTLDDADTKDIVAFLESLTGKFPSQQMPRLPATEGKTFTY
ncbi:cytochrome-c peroxidase [Parasulfuritortus cantonensis]|uniref:Methylamine utilization protein MauG n=1 Tax=Parasulfuritortus cantonensis TaxID=2528202 RepID=A0A4R1BGN3_9PROT|nr:cytochrome-c peroxidase [Parasulfuritortus cantonensis]TCJ16359.1 cytochrome-c peroxidase [Parasulfuritortus cantonensis]